MESQYFLLGMLAAMMVTVGLIVRALHVNRATNRRLSAEKAQLQRELQLLKETAAESRGEAERSNSLVRLLNQEVQQRSSEVDTLRMLLLRRDQEIWLLRKGAEKISSPGQAGKASEESSKPSASTGDQTQLTPGPEQTTSLISQEEQRALLSSVRRTDDWTEMQEKRNAEVGAARYWENSLDRMLGVLDAMEREVNN